MPLLPCQAFWSSFLVKLSGQAFWSSRLAIMARDKKKAPHVAMRCFYKLIWLA
jgi:hypothetical protein